ncbi:MAG: hypothetical protein ACD_3C00041G0003 [uncultured bacterium (gcode 4)]|uniref:Lipoprotein n=1 Tax=uncultured bacterium (gcode 4) TaxID=1234023 RepID=K2G080_9BACT|nr:MAG: hypothetical protein ACD_3C00041G0003 [uncultured bacterium (gcode 4)]
MKKNILYALIPFLLFSCWKEGVKVEQIDLQKEKVQEYSINSNTWKNYTDTWSNIDSKSLIREKIRNLRKYKESQTTEIPTWWTTYSNKTFNYELSYPSDWKFKDTNKDETRDALDTHIFVSNPRKAITYPNSKDWDWWLVSVKINNFSRMKYGELKTPTISEWKSNIKKREIRFNPKVLDDVSLFGMECWVTQTSSHLYRYCFKWDIWYEFSISYLWEKDIEMWEKILRTFKFIK